MKRITVALLLSIILMSSFTSCIVLRHSHEDIKHEDVRSIEIYDIENNGFDPYDPNSDFLSFDPFYILSNNDKERFIEKLQEIEFEKVTPIIPAAMDFFVVLSNYVVKIEFNDGSYNLISSGCTEFYDSDGVYEGADRYSCDFIDWCNFIYSFTGVRSAIINYGSNCMIFSYEENRELERIFSSMEKVDETTDCRFGKEYIVWNGENYYYDREGKPFFKCNDEFYAISKEDNQIFISIIKGDFVSEE